MSSVATTERGPAGAVLGPRSAAIGTTIVVGLGNPLLGDDGVGWRVAERVEHRLRERGGTSDIEVDRLCVGGLALMERLVGYHRAILVDAFVGETVEPGRVWVRRLEEVDVRGASHLDSAHDAPLGVALAAGRALGAALPDDIEVVAIEVERADTFADRLSPAVSASVPGAVDVVLALLSR